MGTLRLELADPTLREWDATVLAAGEEGIVLDRSAFYPGGGGQPPDEGVLVWGGVETRITGTRRTGDDVYLVAADGEPLPPAGTAVRGAIADARRSALMRTHLNIGPGNAAVPENDCWFGAMVAGGAPNSAAY